MKNIYNNGLFASDLERSVPIPEGLAVNNLMGRYLKSVEYRTGADCHVDADQGLVVLSGSFLCKACLGDNDLIFEIQPKEFAKLTLILFLCSSRV